MQNVEKVYQSVQNFEKVSESTKNAQKIYFIFLVNFWGVWVWGVCVCV